MYKKYIFTGISKILSSILFLMIMTLVCKSQVFDFYDKVLGFDDCRYCYFISLDVSSDEYTGKVIIENDDLYIFLNKTKGFEKEQYKKFVKELLVSKKPLILENATLDKENYFLNVDKVSEKKFRVLKDSDKFESFFSEGCIATVSHYFLNKSLNSEKNLNSQNCHDYVNNQKKDNLMIRTPLGIGEESSLISKLFEWEIPVRFDSFSGRIVIDK